MRWIFALLLCLNGCAVVSYDGTPVPEPLPAPAAEPLRYTIESSGFTPDQLQIIIAAFDEWAGAICGSPATLEITDGPGHVTAKSETWDDEPRRLGRARGGVFAVLRTDLAPSVFAHTARHEIGHLLGAAGHHDDVGVMLAEHDPEHPPVRLSAADVALVSQPYCTPVSVAHSTERER